MTVLNENIDLTRADILIGGGGKDIILKISPTPEIDPLINIKLTANLATKAELAALIPTGTVMLFYQAEAPDGWTKIAALNDLAIRVTSGEGGNTGGTVDFETAFASKPVTGTTEDHVLTIAEMPSHNHTQRLPTSNGAAGASSGSPVSGVTNVGTSSTGGNQGHSHEFNGNNIDLDVRHINCILCSKD